MYAITYCDDVAALISRATTLASNGKYPEHIRLTRPILPKNNPSNDVDLKVVMHKVKLAYGTDNPSSLGLVESNIRTFVRDPNNPSVPTFCEEVGLTVLNTGDDMIQVYKEIELGMGENLHPQARDLYKNVLPLDVEGNLKAWIVWARAK